MSEATSYPEMWPEPLRKAKLEDYPDQRVWLEVYVAVINRAACNGEHAAESADNAVRRFRKRFP